MTGSILYEYAKEYDESMALEEWDVLIDEVKEYWNYLAQRINEANEVD